MVLLVLVMLVSHKRRVVAILVIQIQRVQVLANVTIQMTQAVVVMLAIVRHPVIAIRVMTK